MRPRCRTPCISKLTLTGFSLVYGVPHVKRTIKEVMIVVAILFVCVAAIFARRSRLWSCPLDSGELFFTLASLNTWHSRPTLFLVVCVLCLYVLGYLGWFWFWWILCWWLWIWPCQPGAEKSGTPSRLCRWSSPSFSSLMCSCESTWRGGWRWSGSWEFAKLAASVFLFCQPGWVPTLAVTRKPPWINSSCPLLNLTLELMICSD